MTGVLGLRTRAAWRRRWPSLLTIALLVMLALSVTVTAVAGARRTRGAPSRFLRADGSPDVTVSMQKTNSLRGVKELSSQPQVRDVSVNAAMLMFPVDTYMPILAPTDGTGGVTALRGLLLDGRRPDQNATGEILLSEGRARLLHARVGSTLPLIAFDTEQNKRCLNDSEQSAYCTKAFQTPRVFLRVVGIARMGGDVNSRAGDVTVSMVTAGFFARYGHDIAWNPVIFVHLRPGASPTAYVNAARRALPPGVDAQFDLVNTSPTFDAVSVLTTGLLLFALVAGLAGAFAIGQAVVRHVRADDEEREVLASLGSTRRALFADALVPVLVAAILGIALAVLAVYLASTLMPIGFARRLDPRRGRQLDVLAVGAGVVTSLAVLVGATLVAVRSSRRGARARPRPTSISRLLAAIPSAAAAVGVLHACSPGRGRRAIPVRSALVGVAAATAGIVGVLGFSAGLSHLVDTPALYGWTYDLAGVSVAHSAQVLADPAVGAVAEIRIGVPLRVNDRPTYGQVVKPIRGDIGPAIVAGRVPRGPDEVALGADTLDALRSHVGGTVVVSGSDGQLTMRVVGRAVFPTGEDALPLADGVVVSPEAAVALGDGDADHFLAIRYRPGADRRAAFARLDALDAKDDAEASPPERPQPPPEIVKLRQVESLPKVLAGFLALLGVIALAHVLVVAVRRRARDFAVLRALGFRRRNVRAAIAWQAGTLALAGAVIGVPLGIVIARVAWAGTATGIGVMAVHRMPIVVAIAIVPAAVVLAIVIALVPARRAARLRPAQILRTE